MTICIAAISENKKIVAITDKMVTLGSPVTTKYEITENNKAISITSKVIALFAGNVLHANEILKIARSKVGTATKVEDVATVITEAYKEYWVKTLNDDLFSRYGITREVFMGNHNVLENSLVKGINDILLKYNLDVSIIVAGVDTDAHIYVVETPGKMTSVDAIGYASIGSGSQHATLSLIESEYNAAMIKEKCMYAIIDAKIRAEYDPGVGKLCDMLFIESSINKVSPEKLKKILTHFSKCEDRIKKIEEICSKEMVKLI